VRTLEIRQKLWGEEVVVIDEPEYAMKILKIKKLKHTSMHYHPTKKETFYVLEGQVTVRLASGCCGSFCNLMKDQTYTIHPNVKHSIHAVLDSVLIEVSTQPKDDSIRIENQLGEEVAGKN
jgi:mannose-6-phosphate isomerase-like protein (cupin superfamily)